MFTLRVARAIPRGAAVAGTRTLRFQSTIVRVSDSIKRDHRELEEYYNNIMVSKDADTAKRWQNQFVWELARHSIAEEIVVYPAMEKYCTNGQAMADKDRSEHQTVRSPPPSISDEANR
jgi:hemerythrin superfamily protein